MISLKNLSVHIDDKQILSNISYDFELGKNYCLLGKNGSGKSSLAATIMGHPRYRVSAGSIELDGADLIEMPVDERSKAGLFLSYQTITEIKGIRLREYLRTIYNIALTQKKPDTKPLSPFLFQRFLDPILKEFSIDPVFLDRDLNVGFSGGEKRKIEILQMRLLEPRYIILDEVDSGLDVDAFRMIAQMIAQINSPRNTFIIVTHYFTILDHLPIDAVIVLENGTIKEVGGNEVIERIRNRWFADACKECGKPACEILTHK